MFDSSSGSVHRGRNWGLFWRVLGWALFSGSVIVALAKCTYKVDVQDPQVSVGTVDLCVVVDVSDAGQVVLICPDSGHKD